MKLLFMLLFISILYNLSFCTSLCVMRMFLWVIWMLFITIYLKMFVTPALWFTFRFSHLFIHTKGF